MNMKIKKIILLILSISSLASCNKHTEPITPLRETKEIKLDSLTQADTYYMDNGIKKDLNMNALYSNSNSVHLNPLGDQHVLVVPFSFVKNSDDLNDTIDPSSSLLEKIKVTFTGSESEIQSKGGIISVSDFYKKSSFNKANFQVDVLDTFIPYSSTAIQFKQDATNYGGGVYASNYISTKYKEEYSKDNHGILGENAKPFEYYDADKDGYIDLMWIVYAYPYKADNEAFWWAYVTYTNDKTGTVSNPKVQTLGWASTNFLFDSANGYDSHTFIHETGHTFGLQDYYDYNKEFSPLGGIDYMDQNIGDHCAYSKFSLGWTNPYVIKESDIKNNDISFDLNAFTTSNESIILATSSYNNTAFDEYFMLELVAPVSISEKDYKNGYSNINGYSKPGIRITHIDSRVYDENHDTYIKDRDDIGKNGKALRLSNSYFGRVSIRYDSDYYEVEENNRRSKRSYSLISLVESNVKEVNTTNSASYVASNDSLFKKGDSFYLEKDNKPSIWARTYMPSASSLLNKSKSIVGWINNETQIYQIDESEKFPFKIDILDIGEDSKYGYKAKIKVGLA